MPARHRRLLATCAAMLALATVAACGDSADPATPAPSGSATTLTMTDPWVKAATTGMTAAFGTLRNPTDRDLVVMSASSGAAATMELHETAMVDGKMAMRPKQGGFQVPAHGSHELKPGGDHLMLIDLTGPVQPGADLRITLPLADASTVTFTAVGKVFAGGNESYQPSPGGSGLPMPSRPTGSMTMGG